MTQAEYVQIVAVFDELRQERDDLVRRADEAYAVGRTQHGNACSDISTGMRIVTARALSLIDDLFNDTIK